MTETDSEYDERVGRNISDLRKARGLTQSDLADALSQRGLPFRQQTVVKIESGARPVRLKEADAIARALEVDIDVLVDEPLVFDATAVLIQRTQIVRDLWSRLRDLNHTFADALDSLGGWLDRVGNRDGTQVSQIVLNDAQTLLQLDPVLVAEQSLAVRRGDQAKMHEEWGAGIETQVFVRRDAQEALEEGQPAEVDGDDEPDVRFLNVADVAGRLGISKMAVYRLVHGGDLPAVRVGRSFRVAEQDLNAYLAADLRARSGAS